MILRKKRVHSHFVPILSPSAQAAASQPNQFPANKFCGGQCKNDDQKQRQGEDGVKKQQKIGMGGPSSSPKCHQHNKSRRNHCEQGEKGVVGRVEFVVVDDHKYALTGAADRQQQQHHHHCGGGAALEFDADAVQIGDHHLLPVGEHRPNEPASAEEPCSSSNCSSGQQQLALFNRSPIDVPTFCAEFVSIGQTFGLSDRACDELLSLVKRMAPPENNVNLCVDGIEHARNVAAFNCPNVPMPSSGKRGNGGGEGGQRRKGQNGRMANIKDNNCGINNANQELRGAIHRQNEQQQQNLFIKCDSEQVGEDDHGGDGLVVVQHYGNEQMHYVLTLLGRLSNDVSKLRRECAARGAIMVEPTTTTNMAPILAMDDDKNIDHDDDYAEDTFVDDQEEVEEDEDTMPKLPTDDQNHNNTDHDDEDEDDAIGILPPPFWHSHQSGAGRAIGQSHLPTIGQSKQEIDRCRPKYFVKVFDEHDKVVPICDLSRDQMVATVHVSRTDPNTRILYCGDDITGRVLRKLDLSLHLHNPSYCGRAVADALFSPKFLCRFHLPAEGKSGSRSCRDALPAHLLSIFYDSLRKLGVSRIIPSHQHGWLEQARDAVNQRNRDIKVPGCRRKFFQNSDPIFK